MNGTLNVDNRSIFCKDNLEILRNINSNSVDLIYLDPPFNSKKQWNAPIGSHAEGASFKDKWYTSDVDVRWTETYRREYPELYYFLKSTAFYAKESDTSYLSYMSIRLIEMHRVLKSTGSLYYHIDGVMAHYIKIVLDIIFGRDNFRNDIAWCYRGGGNSKKNFARKHDTLLRYSKTKQFVFNKQFVPYSEASQKLVKSRGGTSIDGKKRDLERGAAMPDWWIDINSLQTWSPERNKYPTQKPIALLERIIRASSNEGDVVLDPFCGCATSCVAAEKVGRKWIGIDTSIEAYDLIRQRLISDVDGIGEGQIGLGEGKIPINFRTDLPVRHADDLREEKWVYVVSNDQYDGEYKVGIATNPKSRLNSYQTSDPNRAYKMEYKVLTTNFKEIEEHIHDHFPNRHEWVRADLSDIKNEIIKYNEELG